MLVHGESVCVQRCFLQAHPGRYCAEIQRGNIPNRTIKKLHHQKTTPSKNYTIKKLHHQKTTPTTHTLPMRLPHTAHNAECAHR
jgi:hypothetical protein